MSFDLAKSIESIAPTLATMLGGPLAGTAVTALEGALGLSPGSGKDAVAKVLSSGQLTPDQAVAIRLADMKHAEVIQQQQLDLQKMNEDHELAMGQTAAGDRDSARKRQEATGDRTPAHLAYLMILGFFVVVAVLLYAILGHPDQVTKIDGKGWLLIGSLVTYLARESMAAATYFFGTSNSSDKKTTMLANLSSTQ